MQINFNAKTMKFYLMYYLFLYSVCIYVCLVLDYLRL